MKRFSLFLLALFVAVYLTAQESQDNSTQSRHHFEFSVGEPFSTLWGFNMQSVTKEKNHHFFHEWGEEFRPTIRQGYEDETFVPPLTFGYFYQVLPWLQVGGEIGTFSIKTRERYWSDKTYAHFLETNLYLAVGARFNFYHKKITDLYSSLSLGTNIRMASTQVEPLIYTQERFSWQFTALGIRFGRRFYGNVEIGYGYKGLISAGVGTRF